MACSVVTISRSLGAGGEEIGHMVAKELGYRYADEEIITTAAEKAGVSPETVAQVEHTPGLIERILDAMARAPVADPADTHGWVVSPPSPSPKMFDYEGLIKEVVQETASEGDVVIVAHGASHALAGSSGLLRVFVTASPDVRIERVAGETDLDERKAKKALDDSDHQRHEYLRRFYDVKQELPTHYDLVINTDAVTVPQAAQMVVSAARSR